MKAIVKNETLFLYPGTELIASKVEILRDFILKQFEERSDFNNVTLDVSGVEVVDSLGVNLIIGIYRQANSDSKTFEIIGAGEQFMKVAKFFRFSTIFPVKSKEN